MSLRCALSLLLFALVWQSSWNAPACADGQPIEIDQAVPPLNLRTLYHPQDRHRYLETPVPQTKWVRNLEGQTTLLVRREEGWKQVNLSDGSDQDLDVIAKLTERLSQLDGLDEKQVKTVIDRWLGQTENFAAASLLTIDNSILMVDLKAETRWLTRAAKAWREVSLSPDAKKLAYIAEHDLYVMTLESGQVERLTQDGSETKLNGMLDWVYQEEIYGRGNFRGYWWNDQGSQIAFVKLDTSAVSPFTVTRSRTSKGELLVERYPKAGDAIPVIELWVADLQASANHHSAVLHRLLQDLPPQDTILTRVGWHTQGTRLFVQASNRLQNEVTIYDIDTSQPTEAQTLLRESCDQWLEVMELPRELSTGNELLKLSDLPSGRRRLWKLSRDGATRTPLTPEDFDVRELLAVSTDGNTAWISGDQQRGTAGQQIYRVQLDHPADLTAITSDLPWHAVSISPDQRWMIDRASGVLRPTELWLCNMMTSDKRLLHRERLRLPQRVSHLSWHHIETPDGLQLPGYLIEPATVTATQKYPVLVEVYGGPLAPNVRDQWSTSRFLFHQYLSQQGIGVLVVDNRSSGGRGLADAWAIHRRMGERETDDMVAAAKWLAQVEWVDPQRLAIRGWSFGGYLTLQTMTHSDKFLAGIAGGSVTDWRNYDAFYTERYMGLPDQNQAGYDKTSPVLAAETMHGQVLLLHGEVDDNVHLANTLQMASALQKAGKRFEMMIYPEAAHGIHDPQQNFHLMQTTIDFLFDQFRLPTTE